MVAAYLLLSCSLFSGSAASSEKIIYSVFNQTGDDAVLFTMNPDATDQQQLFSFENHPRHNQGSIKDLSISPDGRYIYFISDNSYVYTPARNNIFRISSDGTQWQQITPGPNSGIWDQSCPCGTVQGYVLQSTGTPYANCPVYLEGKGMVYSGSDGSFVFDNVPPGVRWITAYRPDNSSVFESLSINVEAGLTTDAQLTPYSDYRMNFELPRVYNNRIYHIFWPKTLQWSDHEGIDFHTQYEATGSCTSIPDVDGFDISPDSGKIIISDFEEGCTTNRGIYITDEQSNTPQLLVDMKSDWNYCGVQELFWSPDETMVAAKGCYNWATCLMLFDSATGSVTGSACFDQSLELSMYNVTLHGFSPDGKWILFSNWTGETTNGELSKIGVSEDGALDTDNGVTLLAGVSLAGAVWGELSANLPDTTPAAPHLKVEKTNSAVTISWSAVSAAETYTLYAAPLDLSTVFDLPMGSLTSLTLENWHSPSLYIAVRAQGRNGWSDYSNLEQVP